jgi:hypothetical protein
VQSASVAVEHQLVQSKEELATAQQQAEAATTAKAEAEEQLARQSELLQQLQQAEVAIGGKAEDEAQAELQKQLTAAEGAHANAIAEAVKEAEEKVKAAAMAEAEAAGAAAAEEMVELRTKLQVHMFLLRMCAFFGLPICTHTTAFFLQLLAEQKEHLEAEVKSEDAKVSDGDCDAQDSEEAKDAVKKIMADVFLALHQGFEDETSYTGKQVMKIIRKVMKKATQGHEDEDGEED